MQDTLEIPLSARNSSVSFAIRFGGVTDVRGVFDEVEGTLRIPDCCVERSHVELRVSAASVNTGLALRDHHLRGPGFLDAEHWPWIEFASERVARDTTALRVGGTLSLRGVTLPLTVRAPFEFAQGNGLSALVSFSTDFVVARVAHGVGTGGWRRFNPLNLAIAPDVHMRAELLVPASQLLPALLPALGR